jgi:hypothetical protein
VEVNCDSVLILTSTMGIPGYDTLVHYATPPNSYIGAFIFLSYIVLALYATLSIIISLFAQYKALFNTPTNDAKLNNARAARAQHIKIYAFLASISFATLSYHMLMFLIPHYLAWSRQNTPSLSSVISLSKLHTWMLESTLFQDFAADLVANAPNALWTQSAILATWFWNIWMAQQARRRNFDTRTMHMYILLSQILPISFTATLFIIHLHLTSPDLQPPPDPANSSAKPANSKRKPIASLQIPNLLINAALLAQPALRNHPVFSSLLFFERAMLLLPHSGVVQLRDSEVVKCITVSGGFVVANAAMMRQGLEVGSVLGALRDGGFAVKALGWDAVLGVLVFVVLGWGGGV